VNVDGTVTGLKINEQEHWFVIAAERFVVGTSAIFQVDTNSGLVSMGNVEVGRLKVGAMDAEFLANQRELNGIEGSQKVPGGVIMKSGVIVPRSRGKYRSASSFKSRFRTHAARSCPPPTSTRTIPIATFGFGMSVPRRRLAPP